MVDDLNQLGATMTSPYATGATTGWPGQTAPLAATQSQGGESQLESAELLGDAAPPTVGEAGGDDDDVSNPTGAEAGEEFYEASPDQIGTEFGEESALSDLRNIEGFEGLPAATEAGAEQVALTEAGEAIEAADQAEFLGVLAALVPTLISAVGPAIGKAVVGKLSPRAKKVITRPRPAPTPGATKPDTLSVLIKLLQQAIAKPGGESSAEAAEALPLVEEAAAALELIIGKDDRVRITNTTSVPWRYHCALKIYFPAGQYRGTGWFVGRRAVVTAGHCVYLKSAGGWARRIEVFPGANGSTFPYGKADATSFRSTVGWVNSGKPTHDYGCIVLPTGSFGGANLGAFGFASLTPQQLTASPAVLAGYPGDKPFAELWGMARRIKTVTAQTLIYDVDTMGGQSGAPVYIMHNGQRRVVGIHNYGALTGNSATRVTTPVYKNLAKWRAL
jgi:V8-like Glu-specific endopeptidase